MNGEQFMTPYLPVPLPRGPTWLRKLSPSGPPVHGTTPVPMDQAVSLARPLPRRADTMARPARVRIRRRNPWTRARRRLFGWNVRLPLATVNTPRVGGRQAAPDSWSVKHTVFAMRAWRPYPNNAHRGAMT